MSKNSPKFSHVVITGASSGIGEALALIYAEEGVMLSLTGRNEERLYKVAEICKSKKAKVEAAVICVTNKEEMHEWLQQRDKEIPVDLVIANAGISAGMGGSDEAESSDQINRIFEVNWQGVLNTLTPLLPLMIERKSGHIALMSSLAGFRGWPGAPAYCASKAAVKVYGEALHGSLKKFGICVHIICPGFVKSRMTDVNKFPMPFIISAQKAAKIIKRGIAANKSRIAFPFFTYIIAWLINSAPDGLAQKILANTPKKNAF